MRCSAVQRDRRAYLVVASGGVAGVGETSAAGRLAPMRRSTVIGSYPAQRRANSQLDAAQMTDEGPMAGPLIVTADTRGGRSGMVRSAAAGALPARAQPGRRASDDVPRHAALLGGRTADRLAALAADIPPPQRDASAG